MPIVLDWLNKHKPDVLCLQETKVVDADFPLQPLQDAGYHVTFRGMKAYNGVANLTKIKPSSVKHGFNDGPDSEDFRLLMTEVNGIQIVNTYVPQGFDIESDKYQYKLGWYKRLQSYFDARLKGGKPTVWLGDLNIAPEPIDLANPEGNKKHPCYHDVARQAYKDTVQNRFVDVFRKKYPDEISYTFWDFFAKSFERNRGWRIDHIMATPKLAESCEDVQVDLEPRKAPTPSDHTVVWATFRV